MENLENEIWVETYCSPNYEVSNLGCVRSKDRYIPCGKFGGLRLLKSRIMKGSYKKGYLYFNLKTEKKENVFVSTHQLVYHSFYNTKPIKGMVVDHIDGDKTNNNLNNLQFITSGENTRRGKSHTKRKTKLPMYIYTDYRGYRIEKFIDGKQIRFTRVKSLREAIKRRDKLIELNWPKPIRDEETKYISFNKNSNKFGIQKKLPHGLKWFGYFDTLEEAIQRRDELISNNWDVEN